MVTICAVCTANLFRPVIADTPWSRGHCQHDERDAFTPMTLADLDVPAESLERVTVADYVVLARLFVQGKRLFFDLTRSEAWELTVPAHVIRDMRHGAWAGGTFNRSFEEVDPADGYAVAIRPRGADPIRVPFDREAESVTISTRAPYVGVFADTGSRTVDVDPVAIVATRLEADALGVYCRATGGAYNFADGLGYWAPVLA